MVAIPRRNSFPVCPKCGARCKSIEKHVDGPRCTVFQTLAAYDARGWERAGNYARTLRAYGIPVEYAPVHYAYANKPDSREADPGRVLTADGPFGPSWAIRICAFAEKKAHHRLVKPWLRKAIREELLPRAHHDPEFRDALDTSLRLSGDLPAEWWDKLGFLDQKANTLDHMERVKQMVSIVGQKH